MFFVCVNNIKNAVISLCDVSIKWDWIVTLPRGSFYAFPSVQSLDINEVDFCHRLLREQEVAVVPGTAFGPHGKSHVRASFSTSYDKLVEAADRIERFVESVHAEKNNASAAV
jgi:aspartate/methionine/tyrosine aminotransferase